MYLAVGLRVSLVSDQSRRRDSFERHVAPPGVCGLVNQPRPFALPSDGSVRSSLPSALFAVYVWPFCNELDRSRWEDEADTLFGGDVLELYCGLVVWTPASWTQPVHRPLDVVEAKLTYLMGELDMAAGGLAGEGGRGEAHLISTGTWPEVPVREVELLDAKRAALLLIIVDELVLLYTRHDGGCGDALSGVMGWRLGEMGARR
jgi:hypothetical protein